jgi:hypothetical protein
VVEPPLHGAVLRKHDDGIHWWVLELEGATFGTFQISRPLDGNDYGSTLAEAAYNWLASPTESLKDEGRFTVSDLVVHLGIGSRAIHTLDDTTSKRATVTLKCHAGLTEPTALWITEELLDPRLNQRLHTELNATYGVHIRADREAHGWTLSVDTNVDNQASGLVVATILQALKSIAAGKVSVAELDRMTRALCGPRGRACHRPG